MTTLKANEPPHEHIVRLKGVSKINQQGKIQVRAVDNLSLDIDTGDFCALCGPSGSGKTTVLNLIGGLDVPTRGKVFLENQDLGDLNGAEIARIRRGRGGRHRSPDGRHTSRPRVVILGAARGSSRGRR